MLPLRGVPIPLEGSSETVEYKMRCKFNGKGDWGWSERMKTCVSALRLGVSFPSKYLFIYLFIYLSFFLDLLSRLLTKRHVHVFLLKFCFFFFVCLFLSLFLFPASSPYVLNTCPSLLRKNKNLWPSPSLSFHVCLFVCFFNLYLFPLTISYFMLLSAGGHSAVSICHIGQGFARNWKWKIRLKRMSGVQKSQLRFLSIVIIVGILR